MATKRQNAKTDERGFELLRDAVIELGTPGHEDEDGLFDADYIAGACDLEELAECLIVNCGFRPEEAWEFIGKAAIRQLGKAAEAVAVALKK